LLIYFGENTAVLFTNDFDLLGLENWVLKTPNPRLRPWAMVEIGLEINDLIKCRFLFISNNFI